MLLYTQWIGSIVKIYTMFHLHRQKWNSHRTDMKDGANKEAFSDILIPKFEMLICYAALLTFVISVVGSKN